MKSESDDWENESENSEKWKWLHNWPTYAHKMEQQLILEKTDFWHWKVKVMTVKNESDDCEKWKWWLWKVKVMTVKSESDNKDKWKWWHN